MICLKGECVCNMTGESWVTWWNVTGIGRSAAPAFCYWQLVTLKINKKRFSAFIWIRLDTESYNNVGIEMAATRLGIKVYITRFLVQQRSDLINYYTKHLRESRLSPGNTMLYESFSLSFEHHIWRFDRDVFRWNRLYPKLGYFVPGTISGKAKFLKLIICVRPTSGSDVFRLSLA